jgi:hypothetical protein
MLSRPLQEGAVLSTDNLDLALRAQVFDMAVVIAIAVDAAEPFEDGIAI